MDRKFEKSYDINEYEILTDNGWKDVKSVHKTILYDVWKIETEDGKNLECADDHIVFDNDDNEIFVKDLKINDNINTKNGKSKISCIEKTNRMENMYDVTVDGEKYYSNNILSHNTTTVGSYALYKALFGSDYTVGIASNKEKSSIDVLSRIKLMYEELPFHLKCGVKKYNEKSIEFENGSKILCSATSKDAFRGRSLNLLILDEFAFVERGKAEDFYASNYPTISSSQTARVIIVSTPNGPHNLFHRLYTGAEENRNSYKYMKVSWEDVPGRDKKWAEEQIRDFGMTKFRQEFAIEFIGSTNTLINGDILKRIVDDYKDPEFEDLNGRLKIYEKPIDKSYYILGVDVSKGTGNHRSTIQVLKIESFSKPLVKQVAVFYDNKTDVYEFTRIINRLSIYYNNSYIMVENNAEGSTVVNGLWWDLENERLVNTGNKAANLGVRATRSTKPRAVVLMKKFIENENLKLVDQETLKELSGFIEQSGKFFGKDYYDDLVSALYWACFFFEMKDIIDIDYEEDEMFNLFKEEDEDEDDVWGILSDIEDTVENADFGWLLRD